MPSRTAGAQRGRESTAEPRSGGERSPASREEAPRLLQVGAALGNHATAALIAGGLLHRKVAIGPADDPLEREADRLADHALRRHERRADRLDGTARGAARVRRLRRRRQALLQVRRGRGDDAARARRRRVQRRRWDGGAGRRVARGSRSRPRHVVRPARLLRAALRPRLRRRAPPHRHHRRHCRPRRARPRLHAPRRRRLRRRRVQPERRAAAGGCSPTSSPTWCSRHHRRRGACRSCSDRQRPRKRRLQRRRPRPGRRLPRR